MEKQQSLSAAQVADMIMDQEKFVAVPIDSAGRGARLFVFTGGCYVPNGEAIARTRADDLLGDDSTEAKRNDVVATIKERVKAQEWMVDYGRTVINVRNGLLNWRTGKLEPHDPDFLTPWQIPVNFDPAAESLAARKFLFDLFEDSDVIAVVQELLGLLLIPEPKYDALFILHGEGANGKSTFINMIVQFLGRENIVTIPLHDLASSRFRPAEIENKLAVVGTDIDGQAIKATGLVKAIVSGDEVMVERKFAQPYWIRPVARLVYSCNELPYSDDRSFGFFRRIKIIPFRFKFDGSDPARPPNKDMRDVQWKPEDLSGLLNDALAGLRRLDANRDFSPCGLMDRALNDYQRKVCGVRAFVEDVGLEAGAEADSLVSEALYGEYRSWCDENGRRRVASNVFTSRLQALFPKAKKKREMVEGVQATWWSGIRRKGPSAPLA